MYFADQRFYASLFQDILANRPPCPREENYELIELKELLEARRISTEGSETELRARYFQSDQSKKVSLNESKLLNLMY